MAVTSGAGPAALVHALTETQLCEIIERVLLHADDAVDIASKFLETRGLGQGGRLGRSASLKSLHVRRVENVECDRSSARLFLFPLPLSLPSSFIRAF